jgi:molybdopterin-guanine dinucleotide biosynthesis protein MobB
MGWQNSGKTTLVEKLVAEFVGRGFSVSTVKHAHHEFDLDRPGKDSFRHRAAGAREVLLTSRFRWALLHELRGAEEEPLAAMLARMSAVDLVLVEGYKRDSHPKIETHRAATGAPLMARQDPTVRAVATNDPVGPLHVPVLPLDDAAAVADFIARDLGLPARRGG